MAVSPVRWVTLIVLPLFYMARRHMRLVEKESTPFRLAGFRVFAVLKDGSYSACPFTKTTFSITSINRHQRSTASVTSLLSL
jgi:hypothetical protein